MRLLISGLGAGLLGLVIGALMPKRAAALVTALFGAGARPGEPEPGSRRRPNGPGRGLLEARADGLADAVGRGRRCRSDLPVVRPDQGPRPKPQAGGSLSGVARSVRSGRYTPLCHDDNQDLRTSWTAALRDAGGFVLLWRGLRPGRSGAASAAPQLRTHRPDRQPTARFFRRLVCPRRGPDGVHTGVTFDRESALSKARHQVARRTRACRPRPSVEPIMIGLSSQ